MYALIGTNQKGDLCIMGLHTLNDMTGQVSQQLEYYVQKCICKPLVL